VSTPYAAATTGVKAREEITKILRRFGCESIGFMDDFDKHEVLLAFTHRGRNVQLRASAKGWAQIWLKQNPHSYRSRRSRTEHEQAALRQGHIAVNSILRDSIKGQITAVECGILSFEAVFMPFMLTADGRPLIERVGDLLPEPTESKVVQIPARADFHAASSRRANSKPACVSATCRPVSAFVLEPLQSIADKANAPARSEAAPALQAAPAQLLRRRASWCGADEPSAASTPMGCRPT
jgi:hypothetical protein